MHISVKLSQLNSRAVLQFVDVIHRSAATRAAVVLVKVMAVALTAGATAVVTEKAVLIPMRSLLS